MHSALSIASLFLASASALALPQTTSNITSSSYPTDTEVRVVLSSSQTGEHTTTFKSVDFRKHKSVQSAGPFETLEVLVGADANQDLRCQALDHDGMPLIGLRGENVDVTFSDGTRQGGGGPWTFKEPKEISRIICDPAFVKGNAEDFEIRVTLAGPSELATQTVFKAFEGLDESAPTGSSGPYTTVDILVGAALNADIRCKVIDARGREIVAVRGENTDTTFSDGGPDKNEWTFENSRNRRVSNIICDETFIANPL